MPTGSPQSPVTYYTLPFHAGNSANDTSFQGQSYGPPPSKSPRRDSAEATITLLIGQSPALKTHKLLKSVILTECPTLSRHESPKIRGIYALPHIHPDHFGPIIDYMYDGKLPPTLIHPTDGPTALFGETIGPIYATAIILEMHALQNYIMDQRWSYFHSHRGIYVALEYIGQHFDDGISDTMFYKFSIRNAVAALMNGTIDRAEWDTDLGFIEKYPRAMRDVLSVIAEWIEEPWVEPGRDDPCDYHVHPDGNRCPSGSVANRLSSQSVGSVQNGLSGSGVGLVGSARVTEVLEQDGRRSFYETAPPAYHAELPA